MEHKFVRDQEVAEGESLIQTNKEYLSNQKKKNAEFKRQFQKQYQIDRRSEIEAANQLHKNKISN